MLIRDVRPLGTAVLRGRVLGAAPEEAGRLRVTAMGPGGFLAGVVQPDGTYVLDGLGAGSWRVQAHLVAGSSGRGRRAAGEIDIPPAATEAVASFGL